MAAARGHGRRPPETPAAPDASGAAELRLVLRAALSRLTARQRTVLVLLPHSRLRSSGGTSTFEDLPEAEVARLLGCSVGTVRSTTHRSLARLRELAPELAAREPRRHQPSRGFSPVEVRP
ncbi:hypothetical protein Scel_69280 [Streptomyces cellostaticus]|nr:hypothetical protein Scel_69280 [Streptomyces cellostaticus]